MRKSVLGLIVAGIVVAAGIAAAQVAGPSAEPPAAGVIIPVTGPSTAPVLPEPTKATAPAAAPSAPAGGAAPAKGAKTRTTVKANGHPASHGGKTAAVSQKPRPKTAAKKASGAKHVAKVGGTPKAKHAVAAKQRIPGHHAAVSKPIPLPKTPPPGKSPKPVEPVLPRV